MCVCVEGSEGVLSMGRLFLSRMIQGCEEEQSLGNWSWPKKANEVGVRQVASEGGPLVRACLLSRSPHASLARM